VRDARDIVSNAGAENPIDHPMRAMPPMLPVRADDVLE
jgi:hypothetical protein